MAGRMEEAVTSRDDSRAAGRAACAPKGFAGAAAAASSEKRLAPAKERERTARMHRWLRYGIQLVFFIGAPALFSGAFSGVKYLFAQIGLMRVVEPTAFLLQLVAVLAFTVLFGRFFCGYACAFGAIGDWLYSAVDFLLRKAGASRPKFPVGLVRALSLLKYVVLAAICAACFMGTWSAYSGSSPWAAFAALLSGSVEGISALAIGLFIGIMMLMVLRERAFCQFLCPLGAVFSLMPVLGCSEFVRTRAHCARNCGRCQEACPVDIWPDADTIRHGECVSCGRCADVCPLSNVNMVAIERKPARQERLAAERVHADKAEQPKPNPAARPLRKTREKWHLFRGNETGYVIAKAVLLLLVCWLVGAARYVPPFAEAFGFSLLPF